MAPKVMRTGGKIDIKDATYSDEVIALIPARGGSKRIKRKNIKDFRGKPLIAWSIERCKQIKKADGTPLFDRVIVSTDDPEFKTVAEFWGAECPFLRPDDVSGDKVPVGDTGHWLTCCFWLSIGTDAVVVFFLHRSCFVPLHSVFDRDRGEGSKVRVPHVL